MKTNKQQIMNNITVKKEYDVNGNLTHFKDADGYWYNREFDSKGNETYFEDADGYWTKRQYNANGNQISFTTSGVPA